MINIIGDSCVAADITLNVLHQPYINPFCWNIIDPVSYGKLISNYPDINFSDIKLEKHKTLPKYYVIINNCVKVFYEHYIESPEHKTITKINNNVLYYDIKSYITSKYKSRLKLNHKPLFVLGHTWNVDSVNKKTDYESIILQNKHKYPLIVVVNNAESYNYLKKYINSFTKIYQTNLVKNNTQLANELYNKYRALFNSCDDGVKFNSIVLPSTNARVD